MRNLSLLATRLTCCASLLVAALLCGCWPDPTSASKPVAATHSNSAPTISGSPAQQAYVGVAYSFRPQVADADGDTLSFSIVNQPLWATFSPSTGELSGVPQSADAGSYTGIELRVSDGINSASTQDFSIQVVLADLGAATLSWAAPTLNEDGSQLLGLAGFKIYYGQDSAKLDRVVQLTDPAITRYRIEALLPGTYYFGVSAYTAEGVESRISGLASKVIG